MSISVGGIDLAAGVIDAQYRIAVLEKIVEHMARRMPGTISQEVIKQLQEEALAELQKRYPDAGIKRT